MSDAQSPEVQRLALETALRDNIIPARFKNELDRILQRLQALIVQQAFEQPSEPGKSSFSALLSTVLPKTDRQTEFLTPRINHF